MLLESTIPQLEQLCGDSALLRTRIGEAITVLRAAWSTDEKMRPALSYLVLKGA